MSVTPTSLASNTVLITDTTAQDIVPAASIPADRSIVLHGYTAINVTAAETPVIQLETSAPVALVDQCQPGDPAVATVVKESGVVRVTFSPPIVLPAGLGLTGAAVSAVGDVTVTARFNTQQD